MEGVKVSSNCFVLELLRSQQNCMDFGFIGLIGRGSHVGCGANMESSLHVLNKVTCGFFGFVLGFWYDLAYCHFRQSNLGMDFVKCSFFPEFSIEEHELLQINLSYSFPGETCFGRYLKGVFFTRFLPLGPMQKTLIII